METSMFLARILGPYCVIVALGVLVNLKTYRQVMDDFIANRALVYIGGVFALLFGLLILQCHNTWFFGWGVLITIMGWAGVIKGTYLIFFPGLAVKAIGYYENHSLLLVLRLILVLAVGILLIYSGYFMEPALPV